MSGAAGDGAAAADAQLHPGQVLLAAGELLAAGLLCGFEGPERASFPPPLLLLFPPPDPSFPPPGPSLPRPDPSAPLLPPLPFSPADPDELSLEDPLLDELSPDEPLLVEASPELEEPEFEEDSFLRLSVL